MWRDFGAGDCSSEHRHYRPSSVSSRPRAAAVSLLANGPSLVRCGRPETSIKGIVFDGRCTKMSDISAWKFSVRWPDP